MKSHTINAASLAIGLLAAATLSSACHAQIFDDPFSQYFERGITITPGAGNARDANAAIHTIDPWPPYAGYTRIPGNGREAAGAVGRMYRIPSPFAPRASGGAAVIGGAATGGASTGLGGDAGAAGGGGAQPSAGGGY
jgi:hypothetical protein